MTSTEEQELALTSDEKEDIMEDAGLIGQDYTTDAPRSLFLFNLSSYLLYAQLVLSWALDLVDRVFRKVVRIIGRIISIWPIFLIMIFLLIIGIIMIEYQTHIQQIADIVYDCGIYKALDFIVRNYKIPFIRVPYEFLVIRWNDLVVFILQCIATFVENITDITDFLTFDGIIEALAVTTDFVADCLVKFAVDVCSWRIPFVSDTLQNLLDLWPCVFRWSTTLISLLLYLIGHAIDGTFRFVEFKILCNQLLVIADDCIGNFLEFVTLENTIGQVVEYIAEHPFQVGEFHSAFIFPPGYKHSNSIIPVLLSGVEEVLSLLFRFWKDFVVGLFTLTIISNECYVCHRLRPCDDGGFPYYVHSWFSSLGAAETTRISGVFDTIVPLTQTRELILVPRNTFKFKRFPLNQVLPNPLPTVLTPVGTNLDIDVNSNFIITAGTALGSTDNCLQNPVVRFDANRTTDQYLCEDIIVTPDLINGYMFVRQVNTTQRTVTTNVINSNPFYIFNPGNNTYTLADVGKIVPPTSFGMQFTFDFNAMLGLYTARGMLLVINDILPETKVVDCSQCANLFGTLMSFLFAIVETLVNVMAAAFDVLQKLLTQVTSFTEVTDIGTVRSTLNMFQALIIEDDTRKLCPVGFANLIGFKPTIYAIIRLTGCDNDSGDIFSTWFEDTVNNGVLGCLLASFNIFLPPDQQYDNFGDFFLNVLMPKIFGEDFTNFILVIVDAVDCTEEPSLASCGDNFATHNSINPGAPGVCTGVAANFEDLVFKGGSGFVFPLAGLRGCAIEWVNCIVSRGAGTPRENVTDQLDTLFKIIIAGGLVIDQIVCPFVEAEFCFNLADTNKPFNFTSLEGGCPIPIAFNGGVNRGLRCFEFATCCVIGLNVANPPWAPLLMPPTFSIEFFGTGFVSFLGFILKGAVQIILFVIDVFQTLIGVFGMLATALDFTDCFSTIKIFGKSIVFPDVGCIETKFNNLPSIFNGFNSLQLPSFPFDIANEPVIVKKYLLERNAGNIFVLPAYDVPATLAHVNHSAALEGYMNTLGRKGHEALLQYFLQYEEACIAMGYFPPETLYTLEEYDQTFKEHAEAANVGLRNARITDKVPRNKNEPLANKTPRNNDADSYIHRYLHEVDPQGRAIPLPLVFANDSDARFHVFRSKVLSECMCDAPDNSIRVPLKALVLAGPLVLTVGDNILVNGQCDCFSAPHFSTYHNMTVSDVYNLFADIYRDAILGQLFNITNTNGPCYDVLKMAFLSIDVTETEDLVARNTELYWCMTGTMMGIQVHQHDPARYSAETFISGMPMAIHGVVQFMTDVFGPESEVGQAPVKIGASFDIQKQEFGVDGVLKRRNDKQTYARKNRKRGIVDYIQDQRTTLKQSILGHLLGWTPAPPSPRTDESFRSDESSSASSMLFGVPLVQTIRNYFVGEDPEPIKISPSADAAVHRKSNPIRQHFNRMTTTDDERTLVREQGIAHVASFFRNVSRGMVAVFRHGMHRVRNHPLVKHARTFADDVHNTNVHYSVREAESRYVFPRQDFWSDNGQEFEDNLVASWEIFANNVTGHFGYSLDEVRAAIAARPTYNDYEPEEDDALWDDDEPTWIGHRFQMWIEDIQDTLDAHHAARLNKSEKKSLFMDLVNDIYRAHGLHRKHPSQIRRHVHDLLVRRGLLKPVESGTVTKRDVLTAIVGEVHHSTVVSGDKKHRKHASRNHDNATMDDNEPYFANLTRYIHEQYHRRNMDKHMTTIRKAWDTIQYTLGLKDTHAYHATQALAHHVRTAQDMEHFHQWYSGTNASVRYIPDHGFVTNESDYQDIMHLKRNQFRDHASTPPTKTSIATTIFRTLTGRGQMPGTGRQKHKSLFGSLAWGQWAHRQRRGALLEHQVAHAFPAASRLHKRGIDDADDIDGVSRPSRKSRYAHDKRRQHLDAHAYYAGNLERQRQALREIVSEANYEPSHRDMAQFKEYMTCYHYVDASWTFGPKYVLVESVDMPRKPNATTSHKMRECQHLFESLAKTKEHEINSTALYGHLKVESDGENYFYHRYMTVEEIKAMHLSRGHEYIKNLIRQKVFNGIRKRAQHHHTRIEVKHILNAYRTFDFDPSDLSVAGKGIRPRQNFMHVLGTRSVENLVSGFNFALFVSEKIFVFALKVTFGLLNAIFEHLPNPFNRIRLVPPTSFADAFNQIGEFFLSLDDQFAAFADDPVGVLENKFDFLVDIVLCDIPEDFDGSGPYNFFCFFQGFLPEALYVGIIEPLPRPFLPKQIQWPDEITTRAKTERLIDEGSGMLFDNDRTNDCLGFGDPGPLSHVHIVPCEKCDNPEDDDDDEEAKCAPMPNLGWRRPVKVFSLDPNNNCFLGPMQNASAGDEPNSAGPFCKHCDYTPGMYDSCRDDWGWKDFYDSWFFFLAQLPRLVNRIYHSNRILLLLLLVFPIPFTLFIPEIDITVLLYGIIVFISETMRLTQLLAAVISIIPFGIGMFLSLPLRTWIGRYYFTHFWILFIPWLLSLLFEFPYVPENFLIGFTTRVLNAIKDWGPFHALGIADFLADASDRAARFNNMPLTSVDVFCFYWTSFQNWIAGWLILALILLFIRLYIYFMWRMLVLLIRLVSLVAQRRNIKAGIRAFNVSLHTTPMIRMLMARTEQLYATVEHNEMEIAEVRGDFVMPTEEDMDAVREAQLQQQRRGAPHFVLRGDALRRHHARQNNNLWHAWVVSPLQSVKTRVVQLFSQAAAGPRRHRRKKNQ